MAATGLRAHHSHPLCRKADGGKRTHGKTDKHKSMLALTLVRVLRETFAQNRAGLDASIDSAAATAVTAREVELTFKSRPRRYGLSAIMFNNLNASPRSTLEHY
jgi:hypothetical protein